MSAKDMTQEGVATHFDTRAIPEDAAKKSAQIIQAALAEGRFTLLEPEAKRIIQEYGVPTPDFDVATNAEAAVQLAGQFGCPVVLKIVSPDILHKTEAKGVLVGLESADAVRNGFKTVIDNASRYKPDARITGVLVQKMAPPSIEVMIGSSRDSTFGQTLAFGLGGIFTEVLKDVTLRIVPIVEADAREMVDEIRGAKILDGYRGNRLDKPALVKILVTASKLLEDHDEIEQMDLNPIMVYEEGASVVDARMVLLHG